ncbi:MAG: hypothetical protein JXR77_06765 [Lentisphaeria bacterium]|nr:hypothetical protein [Lentisphaeria bacterium]
MGGLSVAARELGMIVVAGVDLNPSALRTFSRNLPEAEAMAESVGPVSDVAATVEGVLMRSQGVVRSVCEPLGAAYRRAVPASDTELASARNWLMQRSADDWARAARTHSTLSGPERHRLWRIIDGLET